MSLIQPGAGTGPAHGQLPAVMCRELLILPGQASTLRLVSDEEKRAADEAAGAGNQLLLIPARAPERIRDLTLVELGATRVGVIAQVVSRRREADGTAIVKVWVFARALVIRIVELQPFLLAEGAAPRHARQCRRLGGGLRPVVRPEPGDPSP
ncbi:MAG: hypothetical protein ACR2MY_15435 [Candidatus Dormibacteria bacterium]